MCVQKKGGGASCSNLGNSVFSDALGAFGLCIKYEKEGNNFTAFQFSSMYPERSFAKAKSSITDALVNFA